MLKDVIVDLFPEGRFVTVDEIKLGTTVARGGSTVFGDPLTKCVIISRPIAEAPDGSLVSDRRVWDTEVYSPEMVNEWFYEIPTEYPLEPNHATDNKFTDAVLEKATRHLLEPIPATQLAPGQIVLTASGVEGDIEDHDTYWVPEITLFVVGPKDEYGWSVEAEEDSLPLPFTPITEEEETNNHIFLVKQK